MADDLRTLTESGMDVFRSFLAAVRAKPDAGAAPATVDESTSLRISPPIAIERTVLRTRLDAAVHVDRLLSQVDAPRRAGLEASPGFWAWLSLFHFNQVRGVSRNPVAVGEDARYVPETGRGIYRHLIRTSYLTYKIFRAFPQAAMVVLHQPLNQPGELVEQLAASQGLLAIPAVVEAYGRLYYDPSLGQARTGARGSGPGSPRRFVTYMNQIDLTFDLGAMPADSIIDILPAQFDRFKFAPSAR